MPLSYPGVYVEEVSSGVRAIEGVPTSTTAFVGESAPGPVARVTSFGEFESRFGSLNPCAALRSAVELFFRNGGREAVVTGQGFESLADEEFALLYLARDDETYPSVDQLAAAAGFCRKRRAFLIADVAVSAATASEVRKFAADLRSLVGAASADLALYGPWIETEGGKAVAPGGAVAGVVARTEAWRSPAGLGAKVAGATGLTPDFTTNEIDLLSAAGVNWLRSLPGSGPVVWGARTLAAEGEWKYVAIRRLALYIEESLYRGLQWVVFEPIGEPLCAEVRLHVGHFLDGLFRQGALVGATPKEAYFVRCDAETMTQDDIDQGRLVVLVGFAALKPAEFVVIRISVQMAPANVDLLRTGLAALNRGDVETALRLTTEDVVWLPLRAPVSGGYYGHEGIRAFYADTAENFDSFEVSFTEYRDLGDDRILASGTMRARVRGGGVELEAPSAGIAEFRDGKVARWEDFGDRQRAFEAAGLGSSP